ncbi:hypothetical protein V8F33_008112 [Rhypophila sp. PSN 637]
MCCVVCRSCCRTCVSEYAGLPLARSSGPAGYACRGGGDCQLINPSGRKFFGLPLLNQAEISWSMVDTVHARQPVQTAIKKTNHLSHTQTKSSQVAVIDMVKRYDAQRIAGLDMIASINSGVIVVAMFVVFCFTSGLRFICTASAACCLPKQGKVRSDQQGKGSQVIGQLGHG